ncbi:ribonuclease I [Pluralibacter gergoviae]|uniref:Ribonuclease I n=1 Tax=Pluralibacter gergoviae TaxID=61647 RepID=A0AAI9GKK2_PLUGE|nr:ribonuclease I [Pluralibacter gergoviae]EKV0914527.1 ribonuclease I [Pluralibacter gergoviae]EKV9905938.1 ribonuclease I [Pluralibacter gergoviae]EKW7273853.1 ribonuclease I [Pluralibacter gergoviae]ELD4293476.1 ribonuclease I [Pluralibacter gergoviae]ELD4304254.1 ribonuclease I [Pluralibacter gergoviae]
MLRKNIAAVSIGASLIIAHVAQADPLTATRYGDFDRYVLALSWQTGFCQSQYDRNNKPPVECRLDKEPKDKTSYLTVHGLWPGLPKSIAARGVDEGRWMRFGCATRPVPDMPEVRASRKCDAAETGLSLEMANRLNNVMPGSGGKSCLERYEYAKHGVCFGFDPDAYFGTMVRFNGEVKQSAIGQFLAKNYGKTVSREDFDAAIASAYGKESVKAFKLTCNGNPAYLTEMQIAIRAAAVNRPLAADSLLPQPHPGNCGNAFVVDKAGY